MNLKTIISSIIITALFIGGPAIGGGTWKKVKETHDGIVIYLREVPGTSVKEIKVDLTLNIPPRFVLDAACDPASFKDSTKYVEVNKYFWTGDPDVWFTYQLVDYPIITERDYVMRWERTLDPKRGIYILSWETSTKMGPPPSDDAIRVKLATGQMKVMPLDDGKRSRLLYRLLADPGGNIPGWIMNIANKVNMPDIIREIRTAAYLRAKRCAAGDCRFWNATGHQ